MIKVKSVTDVITNSSSETFILKIGSKWEKEFTRELKKRKLSYLIYDHIKIRNLNDLIKKIYNKKLVEWNFSSDGDNQVMHGTVVEPELEELKILLGEENLFNLDIKLVNFIKRGKLKKNLTMLNKFTSIFNSCIGYSFYSFYNNESGWEKVNELIKEIEREYLQEEIFNKSITGDRYEIPIPSYRARGIIEITKPDKFKLISSSDGEDHSHFIENIEDLIICSNVFMFKKLK